MREAATASRPFGDAASGGVPTLLLLGLSHRTARVALRERFAIAEARPLLEELVAAPEVDEALLLSTCNRVELIAVTRSPAAAFARLTSVFERRLEAADVAGLRALRSALYELRDGAAIRQVFRVASAIDSQVVGEPQILGQVKAAYRTAIESGACGSILSRLYERAFATAKRVRSETQVSARPISVARVGVQLASQLFESFEGKWGLMVGAGNMVEQATATFLKSGLTNIRIANRTPERVAALAGRFGASAHGLDELPALLEASDVVLTCVRASEPVLTTRELMAAARARRGRPIFAIDLGVPRNIDPAAQEVEGVFVYDLDDLTEIARANAAERSREAVRGEGILGEEQQRFERWLHSLAAAPTIRSLVERSEAIRSQELARALAGLALGERERLAIEAATRSIVSKLLHAPLSKLRAHHGRGSASLQLDVARSLFGLSDELAEGRSPA